MNNDIDETGRWLDELAETNPVQAHVIARTEIIERLNMPNGEEEVLPAMTLEEVEAFIDAEDEMIKEERDDDA